MFGLFDGFKKKDLQVAVALLYTAALLTVLEYFYLPTTIEARLLGVPAGVRPAPSLEAGVSWSLACIIGYLVIPLLLCLFFHRRHPRQIGFNSKGFGRHVLVYLGLFALMLPVVLFAARADEGFLRTYPFVNDARGSLGAFLRWELAYLAQFIALEAFFRGYLLFTLERAIGKSAIFVMCVPYAMIHFHKPVLECFGAIGAGVLLGLLALRFRSWYGGALLHMLVALTMDSLSVHRSGLF